MNTHSAPNAPGWAALFGYPLMGRQLESSALQVTTWIICPIHMVLHELHLKRTRIAYSWLGFKLNISCLNMITQTIQPQKLASKIEINQRKEPENPLQNTGFYSKYSRFILKALRKTPFQQFVYLMLEAEGIDQKNVNSVKIELYPLQKENGLKIAGKCNPYTGKIRIYPKTAQFCSVFEEKYGKDLLIAYAGSRARAALIHELLHLKYTSDEKQVRKLTETYFSAYIKKVNNSTSGSLSVCNLIFARANLRSITQTPLH